MKQVLLLAAIGLVLVSLLMAAGCSKYADPDLKITTNLTKVSEDPAAGTVTYDLEMYVTNIGGNNAYSVLVLAILSTPKDKPEYQFTTANIDVGTVEKGKIEHFNRQMVLPLNPANYAQVSSGALIPDVSTTITRVSSNVMS
ncbi:MAG TPA: hypothetical protein VN372_09130 [Methanospirillum sp.]|nr:hypothetical protein [Methanospirillum sp.]